MQQQCHCLLHSDIVQLLHRTDANVLMEFFGKVRALQAEVMGQFCNGPVMFWVSAHHAYRGGDDAQGGSIDLYWKAVLDLGMSAAQRMGQMQIHQGIDKGIRSRSAADGFDLFGIGEQGDVVQEVHLPFVLEGDQRG